MEVLADKNIIVKDSLFDPNSKDQETVYYFKGDDGKLRYKVWVLLDGKDTFYVDYVVYRLHSTFSDPVKKIQRTLSNPNCSMVIWTWGVFEMELELRLKTGEKILTSHQMSFGKQLLQPGLKFVKVD